MRILYVCNEYPYPPRHGGLIDMWNRIDALSSLGVSLDVIATVRIEPEPHHRAPVEAKTASLRTVKRHSLLPTVLSARPGHAKSRSALRSIDLHHEYDIVLMQTEYTSEILLNPGLTYRHSVIRVDNNEGLYTLKAARADKSPLNKAYLWQDSFKVRRHSKRILPSVDSLWFVSHDEMKGYLRNRPTRATKQQVGFVPAGIDTAHATKQQLVGSQVLFVGNLSGRLNRIGLEWYIRQVHPLMSDFPGHRLRIVGSTNGKSVSWLDTLTAGTDDITVDLDQEDLTDFYGQSAVFVNPMQDGAGVKLKTVEACLRGLPVVSTDSGAEGSGLVEDTHFRRANTPTEFAAQVRSLLTDKQAAMRMADAAQRFILTNYDQKRALRRLLSELDDREALAR